MAAQQQCTMDHLMQSIYTKSFTAAEMIEIENHIAAEDCPKVHPPLKDLATNVALRCFKTSPLVMACYQGALTVVQRMIEVWGADVEATSFVPIDAESASWMGLNIESTGLMDVTPLFAASLNNRTEFVRYLIGKGANVSARSSTIKTGPFRGLTPLHGALLHGRLPDERLDQIDTIRILLDSGANPSALSSDGTPTWMFGCISFYLNTRHFRNKGFCNVQAITLLIEHGMSIVQRCPKLNRTLLHHMAGPANEFDDVKIVKLILEKGADPNIRDNHGLTPIMTAAIGTNLLPNMFILKFLMERDDIPNRDKIEALEVALAVLLSYDDNLVHTHDIDYCLSQAQRLRIIEGITLIPKCRVNGRDVEWVTSSDLEGILQRPSELGMQSILIRLRIFSVMSWETVYRYLCLYIFLAYFPKIYLQYQSAQLLDMSWTMLETIRRFAPINGHSKQVFDVTGQAVETIVDTLSDLKKNRDPLFNMVRKMISTLVGMPDVMIQPIANYLREIVDQNNKAIDQEKLIYIACMEQTEHTCDIVRFLFKFGAFPDVVDFDGDGPLHIFARSNGEFTSSIARVLLDAGTHLDRSNKKGLTAADVWIERETIKRLLLGDHQPCGWRDLPDWLREDVPKLQCLSARIIRSRRIPYKKVVPVTLHPFVALH